jgi:hypothetical protein
MAEIIKFEDLLKKKEEANLEKIRHELDIELEILGLDIEAELNKYVLFDTSNYKMWEYSKEEYDEIALEALLSACDILTKSKNLQAVVEIENIITRIKNQSYQQEVEK